MKLSIIKEKTSSRVKSFQLKIQIPDKESIKPVSVTFMPNITLPQNRKCNGYDQDISPDYLNH